MCRPPSCQWQRVAGHCCQFTCLDAADLAPVERTLALTILPSLLRLRRGSGVVWWSCLSVCLSVREHIFGNSRPIFTKFCVPITYGRGSILLWHRRDMLSTSGFMDDVILAHKPRQLNVAAQLIEAQLTCSLGFGYAMNGPLRANVLTLTGLYTFWCPRSGPCTQCPCVYNNTKMTVWRALEVTPGGATGGGVCSLCDCLVVPWHGAPCHQWPPSPVWMHFGNGAGSYCMRYSPVVNLCNMFCWV